MSAILDKLESICNEITDNIENVNRGGCGFVAYIIADVLSVFVPTRISGLTRCTEEVNDLDIIRNTTNSSDYCYELDRWINNGVDFTHFMVEFDVDGKSYQVDSRGVTYSRKHDERYGVKHKGFLTREELKRMVAVDYMWNPAFNRDNIPFIESIVKKQFQEMIENHKDMMYNELYQGESVCHSLSVK